MKPPGGAIIQSLRARPSARMSGAVKPPVLALSTRVAGWEPIGSLCQSDRILSPWQRYEAVPDEIIARDRADPIAASRVVADVTLGHA